MRASNGGPPPLQSGCRVGVLVFCILLAACVSNPRPELQTAAVVTSEQINASPKHWQMGRRIAGIGQAATLAARSWYIDPILRPASTLSAYYALIGKSALGFARRVAINAVQIRALERRPIPPLTQRAFMDSASWEAHLDRTIGGLKSSGSVDFLVDGEEFFTRFNRAVEHAESTIDIRTYIFDSDDYGVFIADRLKERSSEVDVRVLLDGLGELFATQSDPATMPPDFRPPHSMPSYLRRGSKIKTRTRTNPWMTGDHTKTTIIDREVAFVGGMNIGREYRYDWHDMMMEVRGPVVDVIQREFDKTWARSGPLGDAALLARFLLKRRKASNTGGVPLRLLFTRDFNSQIYRAQLAAIRRAQSRVYIQNAYLSDDLVVYELAKARRRGVDVRVIIAEQADDATMNLSNASTINVLLGAGVRVYRYPGMTHLKAAVYDGWACMGSGNFDKMSLQVNEELNLGTSDPDTVRRLVERVFAPDFQRSQELVEPLPLTWIHRVAEVMADEFL